MDFSKRRFPGVDSRHEKAFTCGRDKMEYKVDLAFFSAVEIVLIFLCLSGEKSSF